MSAIVGVYREFSVITNTGGREHQQLIMEKTSVVGGASSIVGVSRQFSVTTNKRSKGTPTINLAPNLVVGVPWKLHLKNCFISPGNTNNGKRKLQQLILY